MKNLLSAFVLLLFTSACGNRQTNPSISDCNDASNEVAFEVAKNYFYKNNPKGLPGCPKITSDEVFNALFGMATTMGENGKPTEIDFTKQFVLAVVLPATDVETEVNPIKVEERGDSLLYTFEVKKGEKLTYSIKPLSIIILDKKYANKEVVLECGQEVSYFPAIDRYLVEEIGRYYAQGEHCVPLRNIVAVDESHAEDILVWGDFWVFNYNQAGDTLKCISGGSHPGLMHMRQTEKGYEVTAFDRVADGSDFLPSAKKIFGDRYDTFQAVYSDDVAREKLRSEGLAAYVRQKGLAVTLYQDYGWPARKLK